MTEIATPFTDQNRAWSSRTTRQRLVAEQAPVAGASGRFRAPSAVADWADLIRFRPSAAILGQIGARRPSHYRLQTIAGASSDNINLDFYPVYVSRMPTLNGNRMTSAQLFRRFRTRINDFLDTDVSEFSPVSSADTARWLSPDPRGTVIFINIEGPDNAYVVCSDQGPRHWRFNTLTKRTPLMGRYTTHWIEDEHPVSGTREFGYQGSEERAVFYTKGADRATYSLEFLNRQVFAGGHKLWLSFQRHFVNWVNRHGGRAERFAFGDPRPNSHLSQRLPWSQVRRDLGI